MRATFVGHDHVNDYCGRYPGDQMMWACYGGGIGYGTYGRLLSPRRARIVELAYNGTLSAESWKRLDDDAFSRIDVQKLL